MVRQDVSIVVQEHERTGADLVTVTALHPDYPPELLRSQIDTLGRLLASEPRGVAVFEQKMGAEDGGDLVFLKATFAVDGLIDRRQGELRISPILQAFAGVPAPFTVTGISLVFDGERPGPNTISVIETQGLRGEARVMPGDSGLEYRFELKSQNPEMLVVPDRRPEPTEAAKPSVGRSGLPVWVWIAIVAAGVGAGLLVYLALLRAGTPRSRRASR